MFDVSVTLAPSPGWTLIPQSSSIYKETESEAQFAPSHKMLFFSEKSLYSETEETFNVDTENYLVSEHTYWNRCIGCGYYIPSSINVHLVEY